MAVIYLSHREEATNPAVGADQAGQQGENWMAAYILIPCVIVGGVIGSIVYWRVQEHRRKRKRRIVDIEAQRRHRDEVQRRWFSWLDEVNARASTLWPAGTAPVVQEDPVQHSSESDGSDHARRASLPQRPKPSHPAHSIVGKFAFRFGRRRDDAPDKSKEEHELTTWPSASYETQGAKDLKAKVKAGIHVSKKREEEQVKIDPKTGLPYGITVRHLRQEDNNPYGWTEQPQFIGRDGLPITDRDEVAKLKAMAAGTYAPPSPSSTRDHHSPALKSGIPDAQGSGYGYRRPSDEWPLDPGTADADASSSHHSVNRPYGGGSAGTAHDRSTSDIPQPAGAGAGARSQPRPAAAASRYYRNEQGMIRQRSPVPRTRADSTRLPQQEPPTPTPGSGSGSGSGASAEKTSRGRAAAAYGLVPPVAYEGETAGQKAARLERQAVIRNTYREVGDLSAGPSEEKKGRGRDKGKRLSPVKRDGGGGGNGNGSRNGGGNGSGSKDKGKGKEVKGGRPAWK